MANVDNMQVSIYIDREDHKSIEEEERNLFLRGVLEEVGVPVDDIWPELELTVEQKVEMRDLLTKLDIDIIADNDRGYKIYHEDSLLAEWFKPRFILREDKGAKVFSSKLYYEMVIKTWSIFEQEESDDN